MTPEQITSTESLLKQGLLAQQISLDASQQQQLLDYLREFHKWNQAYNLSAIRDPDTMVGRHLLDSLSLVPLLQSFCETRSEPVTLVDVGTGGGLPGLPLAIAFPQIRVTLLDSNGKKTRFLFQTALKLGLKNVQVENNRVERFSPANKFAIVTSRAFASLHDMVSNTRHLLDENGQYWAMKGVYPQQELAECDPLIQLVSTHKLLVPQTEGERHLIILKPH